LTTTFTVVLPATSLKLHSAMTDLAVPEYRAPVLLSLMFSTWSSMIDPRCVWRRVEHAPPLHRGANSHVPVSRVGTFMFCFAVRRRLMSKSPTSRAAEMGLAAGFGVGFGVGFGLGVGVGVGVGAGGGCVTSYV
jgi:hypothetical protein